MEILNNSNGNKMIRLDIRAAVDSLVPNNGSHIKNGKIAEWRSDETQPTEAEIDAELIRLEAEWTANQYQRDRQYPSIGDQLDMQYHDEIDGTTTWKDAVAKVKADHPKG